MLVLSRKIGEKIVLPETGVSIVLLGVHGKRARIGIEGPPGVTIHRDEVWQRIAHERDAAPIEPSAHEPACECSVPPQAAPC